MSLNWVDIRNDIEDVAPMAAAALSGPYAPIVGAAVSGILGVSHTPEAVRTTLKNNPAASLALANFDNDHGDILKDLGAFIQDDIAGQVRLDAADKTARRFTLYVLGLPLVSATY